MSYAKYAGGGHEEETPQEYYYEGEGGGYEGGGYELPPEYYEQPEETGRAWNVHYSPTWFVEEQENRLNPEYQSEAPENMSGEMIDAVANYVKGWQQQNPTEWRYGDPGWDRTGDLWRDTIKPLEQQYQAEQEALQRQQAQEQAQQRQMSQPPVQGQVDPNAQQGEAPVQIEQQQELQPPQVQSPRQYDYDSGNFSMVQDRDFNGRKIGNMYAGPPPESAMEQAATMINSDPKYSGLRIDQSGANYDNMRWDEKALYLGLPSTNGTDVENAPTYARYTQPFVTSIMSSAGTGAVAKFLTSLLGGPAGKVGFVTSAATFGYNYARQQNWIQGNKYLDKIIELTDYMDDKGAQAQAALAYAWEKVGGDDISKGGITDLGSTINNWKFFFDNFDQIMYYAFGEGKASSEFNPEVVGIVGKLAPNMGANAVGSGQNTSRIVRNFLSKIADPNSEWIDRGETTRNNMGLSGVYEIPEEMMGSNAIMYWLQFGQNLYDRGITNPEELEYIIGHYVNQVYGDLSNLSEFFEHEMGDLGNFGETIQPRVMQVAGNITHDANLAQAAKNVQGNFAFDMLGQLPAGQQIQNAVQTVAKAFGKNINASGGIDEVLTEWNNLNMTSNVEDLTWRDRNLSGITEDGKLKSFTPNVDPHTVKNPLVRNFERIKNFFSTTNEWKATMSGDAMFEYINLAMDDILEQHPDETAEQTEARLMQFVDELENPDTISENSPFAKSSQSVLFNTIKYDLADAVKNHKAEITKAISDYSKLNNNRRTLNTLAEALGLSPSEVMQKYDKEKTVLTQMIVNKADENGGTIPGIVDANGQPIAVESKAFGDRVISMLKPFSGDEGKAYDPRLLSMQLTSQIADGITTTLTTKYNIKPEKWVYRFGDMVKKMQHLWLLGLSPSYLANNLVNNVVTRTALGYGGWLSPRAISDWNERFGFQPERFAESTAAEMLGTTQGDGKTGHQKLMEAIKERKEKKDIFSFVNKGSSWASEHLGFFGKISGKIEENESKQIMASAMMSYHARTWKPGVNFRKMPAQLENAIRAENPAILDAIYAAISAGANMKEIENAIYGTFIIPSVRDTLVQAAQNIGIADSEEAVYSFFDQGGMMSALNKALQGKRGKEILDVVDDFIARVKAVSLINLSEDFSKRAESIGNMTANEAFAEAIRLGHEISDDMTKVWLESMDANDVLFSRRISENIPSSEFRAMFVAQQKALNERWNNVYAKVEQTYAGIVKGLGMSTKTQEQYNAAVLAKNNIWRTFYTKTQPEAIQPYLDALVRQTGDTFESWDSRVRKAWSDYTKDIKNKYATATQNELGIQETIDDIFAKGLKQGLGNVNGAKVDEIIVPLQQQIRDIRQKIIELTKQTHGKADNNPSLNVKDMAWKAANDERTRIITDKENGYYALQKKLYDEIDKLGPQTSAQESEIHRDDQSHADNINSDRVERKAAEDQKVYEEFTNTVTEKVAEAEDPETVLNDVQEVMEEVRADDPTASPKEVMEQYLNRNNLRDVAKMAGATDEQADAYARLMGARAKAWERQHPGKDYFRDELKMRVSRIDEDRTVEIERIKGEFRVEDGEKLVKLFRGSDLSTLIHETAGHGFASTLNDSQKEALAAYNGWTYAKYRHLEEAFYYYPDTLTAEERQAWIDSQEKFAYGFEQYLMEGKAPNSKMAEVFEAFKQYLLDIYKGLKNLIYKGEPINIHEVNNGVSLAQIFDSMLSEQPARFSIDSSNLTGLQGESITLDNHRATDSFMRNRNREYFQAESDKQLEKFNAIKTAAENKLKNSVADYVQDIENEYKLTIDESMELVIEIMHGFGLNQDLQENEAMKNLIDSKTGNQRQHLVNEFVTKSENREAAVNISDEAVEKFMQDIHDDPEHFDQWKALYAYEQTNENDQAAEEARLTNQTARFMNGKYVPLDDVDLKILPGAGKKDDAIFRLAKRLYEEEQRDPRYSKIKESYHFLLEDYYDFIAGTVDENGKPVQSKQTRDRIAENIQKYNFSFDDPNHTNAMDEINAIQRNMPTRETPPKTGTYVVQTYNFTHGEHEVVGAVYHDGALVAYIPKDMKVDRITSEGSDDNVRRIGVSPQNPSLWVYMDETGVHTEPNRKTEAPKNPYKPEMEKNSMPDIDPVAQINDEVSYDQIINMLQEFGRLYKTRVDDASNTTKFGNLDANTRQMLKDYIENDVRQDMMNAKFRTGKFGEMMRDAALLNYSKRYGFDNFLTLLCPYQFWNTRSMWNWFQRMSGKGGRLWRKYARLKDIERRNLKEIMPSRMTGKIGIPIPGMPDWMGGGLFMPTSQLNIIGNFMDPIYETFGDKNAIIATAERFCQEALDDGRISYEQWLDTADAAKRNSSPIWQEMYAKAQQESSAEPDMGSLFKQYFGMPLPITIGKAVLSGQPGDWNQTPMTRTGTAWRAIFGDNVVGKAGQFALSLPERIIRDAVVKATGNNDFEYKEFGYFGDYYIRQQVWDMVVEGRIDPKDAIEAVIAKDGNAIWDEAAQRQRMEVLQKTQVLSAMAPVKKMAEDIANGKAAGEALKEDYAYVLSGAVSALFPTTIVRDAEMTWRGQKAEMADLYAANDKEGQKRFHEANPNYTYNNLRYEDDPEVSLRKYLYKSITDVWYDLDKASQAQLKMTFGNDFIRDVIDKDTRAIEAMDINRLWAYAQAMHGKTPYLATDKLKTAGVTNPPVIQPVQIPRAEKIGYNVYISERERLWPGMADVENIYYNLPPEDRKMFRNVNPNLGKYWDWKRQYKDEHPEVESFSRRQSYYYNIAEAEDFCAMADPLVLGAITRSAYTGKKPDKDYEYLIRQGMASVGSTKSYDDFLENVYNYILGK